MAKKAAAKPTHTQHELVHAADTIIEKLKGEIFSCEGTPNVNVKLEDNTFRTKGLMPSFSFALSYAYVGSKGGLIFGLEHVDREPGNFKYAELPLTKIEGIFPEIGMKAATAIGCVAEDVPGIIDWIIEDDKAQRKQAVADIPGWGDFS